MTDRNRTYQNGRVSTHSDVQCGSANRQTSFSGNARIKLPFSGPIANKFRRPTILQLNIEGLTASKMNVLHHLAMQSEALVSTVKVLPGSVLLCPRPVPGLLEWAYPEQLGLSSTACRLVLGDSISPCTNGVSLLHRIASVAPLSKPQTMF